MTILSLKSLGPALKTVLLLTLVTASPFLLIYLGHKMQLLNTTTGIMDPGIWQVLALSALSFMGLIALSGWLLHRIWMQSGLPSLHILVSQFNQLTPWQQHLLYLALFALLVLSGTGCLIAIC